MWRVPLLIARRTAGGPRRDELNVGDRYGITSHVFVLAGAPSSDQILYDPTFGCFSGTTDGTPVSFHSVINCLRDGRAS